jgi:serine/threonine-protein kinase
MSQGGEAGNRKAMDFFRKAADADPAYALAYAGIANAWFNLADFHLPPREAMPQARAAAQHALELDEMLPEAHYLFADVNFAFDWNWALAEQHFKRAIELNPNFAAARADYAVQLAALKRPAEARAQILRAEQGDPFSELAFADGAWVGVLSRTPQEAVEQGRAAVRINPQEPIGHAFLGLACASQGDFVQAISAGETAVNIDSSPLILAFLGSSYAQAGKRPQAEKVLAKLKGEFSQRYVCRYELGTIELLLGRKDEAFRLYDQAFEDRSTCMPFLWADPRLDSIRNDPRYLDLVRRMNFPQ